MTTTTIKQDKVGNSITVDHMMSQSTAQRSISDEHLHTLLTHTKSVPEQKQQPVPGWSIFV